MIRLFLGASAGVQLEGFFRVLLHVVKWRFIEGSVVGCQMEVHREFC